MVWLMDSYPESMYKLKPIIARDLLSKIIDDERIIEDVVSDDTEMTGNGNNQKIVSIYLFLEDIRKKLKELRGTVISFDDADYLLHGMILANSEITQFFIEKAQYEDSFSYDEIYSQSNIMIEYIKVIRDDMGRRMNLQNFYPDYNIMENHMLQIISEYDVLLIEMHVEYLIMITTLMCIYISPFYDETNKRIAEWFLCCFKDILANSRIEEMYMEPNTFFSEEECGPRTTTKLEIFFSQSNGDRYQLRVDFPHDDVDFIHFNLYEPFADAAFPIDNDEYSILYNKYGENVKQLFYHCGGKYWFKRRFESKILSHDNIKPELRKDASILFNEHMHYPICGAQVTESEMKNFLAELFSAVSSIGMEHSIFKKPKNVNEVKRLEKISLVQNIRYAAYKLDAASIYNLQSGTIPLELVNEIGQIEIKLKNVLTEYYMKFKREELEEFTCEDLLDLVRDCIEENY